jgi:hypothetical protein
MYCTSLVFRKERGALHMKSHHAVLLFTMSRRVHRIPGLNLAYHTEPEFLNISWRLKSRLFEESCLFKGHSVQQGSQWLQFFGCCILQIFLC